MSKELKANLLFLIYDHRYSVLVFWSVLLVSTLSLFLIAWLTSNAQMILSLEGAIYIYCGIAGFVITKETFPYLIKLGSTRGMYVLSVLIFNVLLAIFMSIISVLVIRITRPIFEIANIDNFHIFSILNQSMIASTWYNELWINTMVCFLLLSFGSLIGCLFYRFGLLGGFACVALFLVFIIVPDIRSTIAELLGTFNHNRVELNYFTIIIASFLVFLPYWFILRNASTTAGVTR